MQLPSGKQTKQKQQQRQRQQQQAVARAWPRAHCGPCVPQLPSAGSAARSLAGLLTGCQAGPHPCESGPGRVGSPPAGFTGGGSSRVSTVQCSTCGQLAAEEGGRSGRLLLVACGLAGVWGPARGWSVSPPRPSLPTPSLPGGARGRACAFVAAGRQPPLALPPPLLPTPHLPPPTVPVAPPLLACPPLSIVRPLSPPPSSSPPFRRLARRLRPHPPHPPPQPMEIYVDDEAKLTLHGLVQHYVMLNEDQKNRKLNDLLDALDFNQVWAGGRAAVARGGDGGGVDGVGLPWLAGCMHACMHACVRQRGRSVSPGSPSALLTAPLPPPLPLQVVIFVKSVARARSLNTLLNECNFPSIAIHSSMKMEERLQVGAGVEAGAGRDGWRLGRNAALHPRGPPVAPPPPPPPPPPPVPTTAPAASPPHRCRTTAPPPTHCSAGVQGLQGGRQAHPGGHRPGEWCWVLCAGCWAGCWVVARDAWWKSFPLVQCLNPQPRRPHAPPPPAALCRPHTAQVGRGIDIERVNIVINYDMPETGGC